MASKITYSTIESNSYNTIFEYLNNRNYIKDPRNASSSQNVRVFVYKTDPFHKSINFSQFPYIVLEPPRIEKINPTGDGRNKLVTWTYRIIVRASKNGASNYGNDVGFDDMQAIADDLFETFNSKARKRELTVLNVLNVNIDKINTEVLVIDQKTVYEWTFELTHSTRIYLSA